MKIHTSLNYPDMQAALNEAIAAGQVERGVYFDKLDVKGSRTHPRGIDVHLAIDTKTAGSKRRRPNPGTGGFGGFTEYDPWAATWDEWGWFLARVFDAAPNARTAYDADATAFHARTAGKFAPVSA